MITIPLTTEPRQSLSILLGGLLHDISVVACEGFTAVSVARDGVDIITGHRAVAGQWVLPYRYKEYGNFLFTTDNDDLPDTDKFGVTQFMVWFSPDELEATRV